MLRRILTIIGYIFVAAIIIGATVLLVAYGQGYEFSFSRGKIVHKGLVLINSTPGSALVTRSDSSLRKHTSYHATYSPGSYTFTVSKDNYRSWTKTLTVTPGEVSDARYVVLLPSTLQHTTTASASSFVHLTQSTDLHHIAYVLPATATEPESVWTVDLPNGQPTRRFILPTPSDTVAAETIDSIQWSGDSSHLLIFSHSAAGSIVRVVQSDGTNLQNLTTTYSSDLSSLQFAPTDWHLIYGITSKGELRRIDLGSSTLSGVLATNVSQVTFANDQVLFVQTTDLGKTLQSSPVHSPTEINRLIPSLPASPSYTISYSTYQGNDELIIIPASTREATYYSGIFGSSPVSTVVARDVDNATFAPNGRFVALYSGITLATYDILLSKPTQVVTYQSPALGAALIGLSWADNYHLVMNLGGKEVFTDFDGTNRSTLASTDATDAPFASSDEHTAYALSPVANSKQQLIATALR